MMRYTFIYYRRFNANKIEGRYTYLIFSTNRRSAKLDMEHLVKNVTLSDCVPLQLYSFENVIFNVTLIWFSALRHRRLQVSFIYLSLSPTYQPQTEVSSFIRFWIL